MLKISLSRSILPDRLKVGQRFLEPSIGVRVPVGQHVAKMGREHLVFYERSDIKYLVIRDQVLLG